LVSDSFSATRRTIVVFPTPGCPVSNRFTDYPSHIARHNAMVSISGNVRNPTRPEPVTVLSYGTGLINRLLRHIFAIAVLPVTVVILVPLWIARRYDVTVTIPDSAAAIGAAVAGVGFLVL